jgi:predicted RNA binding protein YcfA (HicA-like mRNA interferase family)
MPAIKPIDYSKLVNIFELDGWVYNRTKGDRLIYTKPGFNRPVIIPKWGAIPVFIIQNNMRTAGMSRERYFELFAQS